MTRASSQSRTHSFTGTYAREIAGGFWFCGRIAAVVLDVAVDVAVVVVVDVVVDVVVIVVVVVQR